MLSLARRRGDVELAQDVFGFLGKRGIIYERQHYEMMIETFLRGGIPQNGLHVLSAMHEAGVEPDEGTTRGISVWLTNQPHNIRPAFDELRAIKARGAPVPVAAVNVLIEAATKHRDVFLAIDLYKSIPEVCSGLANLETFNGLLRMCRKAGRQDLAFKLVGEMVAAKVAPSALTYDLMVLICIRSSDIEDAMQYYREMRAKGFMLRLNTAGDLLYRLTKQGDDRVWTVLDDMLKTYPSLRSDTLSVWVREHLGNERARYSKLEWLLTDEDVFVRRAG
jgi:pentatricopeptide repeat protein